MLATLQQACRRMSRIGHRRSCNKNHIAPEVITSNSTQLVHVLLTRDTHWQQIGCHESYVAAAVFSVRSQKHTSHGGQEVATRRSQISPNSGAISSPDPTFHFSAPLHTGWTSGSLPDLDRCCNAIETSLSKRTLPQRHLASSDLSNHLEYCNIRDSISYYRQAYDNSHANSHKSKNAGFEKSSLLGCAWILTDLEPPR